MSQVTLINLRWDLEDAFMFHFLFLRVVVALRYSWWKGDLTSFLPRMNTVLSVTCLSSLTLLTFFAYVHPLVRENPIIVLTASSLDLRRLSSGLTYFNIYKNEDCIVFPNLKHYSRSASYQYQCTTQKF